MAYDQSNIETYETENPYDARLLEIRTKLDELNSKHWQKQPDESDLEFRRRVEQTYHFVCDPSLCAEYDKGELQGHKERWVTEKARDLTWQRHFENADQVDEKLREGGQFAAVREVEDFRRDAFQNKNTELMPNSKN